MKKHKSSVIRFSQRLSLLVSLVCLVFVILFVSIAVSGFILFSLTRTGILPPLTESRFPMMLAFLLVVSLFIGTLLAIFGGERFLSSHRKLIEATKEIALGNFNIRLDTKGPREITRIAESFNEMAKELSSIETLRSDFINNISHEFKTPIVSIKGFARRLKRDITEEQRNEYIDIIISESDRLTRLSSNVLLLSRLESTDKDRDRDRDEYFLDEQLRRAILLLEPQLQRKQLEIDAKIEAVQIFAGEEILNHLWINLIGNAIKFSPDGGIIRITLTQNADEAIVSISDMGIGMDDEVKKHIFDKFYQADTSRATEGNGLGMSLVKRILELENGNITVESEPGRGTIFTISLPIR